MKSISNVQYHSTETLSLATQQRDTECRPAASPTTIVTMPPPNQPALAALSNSLLSSPPTSAFALLTAVAAASPPSTLPPLTRPPAPAPTYPCPYTSCSKTFARPYQRRVHLRRHTGETPYRCPVPGCAKMFKWRSSMSHHNKMHERRGQLPPLLPIVQEKNIAKADLRRRARARAEMEKEREFGADRFETGERYAGEASAGGGGVEDGSRGGPM